MTRDRLSAAGRIELRYNYFGTKGQMIIWKGSFFIAS
jgi:hypothetical protein